MKIDPVLVDKALSLFKLDFDNLEREGRAGLLELEKENDPDKNADFLGKLTLKLNEICDKYGVRINFRIMGQQYFLGTGFDNCSLWSAWEYKPSFEYAFDYNRIENFFNEM